MYSSLINSLIHELSSYFQNCPLVKSFSIYPCFFSTPPDPLLAPNNLQSFINIPDHLVKLKFTLTLHRELMRSLSEHLCQHGIIASMSISKEIVKDEFVLQKKPYCDEILQLISMTGQSVTEQELLYDAAGNINKLFGEIIHQFEEREDTNFFVGTFELKVADLLLPDYKNWVLSTFSLLFSPPIFPDLPTEHDFTDLSTLNDQSTTTNFSSSSSTNTPSSTNTDLSTNNDPSSTNTDPSSSSTNTDPSLTNNDHSSTNTDHSLTNNDSSFTNNDSASTNTDSLSTNNDSSLTNNDSSSTNTDSSSTNTDSLINNDDSSS